MKINPFTPLLTVFVALMLCVSGCNAPAKETATADAPTMTAAQKQAIEQDVTAHVHELLEAAEKKNIERCMTVFENTPDFLAVNPDGTLGDYIALKKLNADGFDQMATLKITPQKEVIRVLSASQVLYTLSTRQAATLKTGQRATYADVTATMLFTNINGAWKATYYHESAAPPVMVN